MEVIDNHGKNDRKNVGKTNCRNEELAFLAKVIKESRRSRRKQASILDFSPSHQPDKYAG